MTEIVLVKRGPVQLTDVESAAVRRVLFESVDGLSEAHKKSWRRIWSWLMKSAEPGEMIEITTKRERVGKYHRRHMLLEATVFQAQERFEHFKQFRVWLKTGAGFCDWIPGPKGGVIPIAKSISYADLEQEDMEHFHADAVAFLRTPYACKTLWPSLPPLQQANAIEVIFDRFNE